MLKRRSVRRSSLPGGGVALTLTGNLQVDAALERHEQVETGAKAIYASVRTYLAQVRELSGASASLTRSLTNYYAGSGALERSRAFEEAHARVDKEIPDTLLQIGDEHIAKPLETYMAALDKVREEIKTFQTMQKNWQHYVGKMEKLEQEQAKRKAETKVDKPKHIEKLVRNRKKLDEARSARDALIVSLVNQLNYFYETRITTMDPVLKHVWQFQQEFFVQSGVALGGELPEVPEGANSSSHTTAAPTMPPPPVNTRFAFDQDGNRLDSSPESHSQASANTPSPVYRHVAATVATSPPTASAVPARPRPAAPGPGAAQPQAPQPRGPRRTGVHVVSDHGAFDSDQDEPPKPDANLVDKWFAV